MIDKLCVCGHAMEPRGAQTLEMNGSYLGSGLNTDYVDVKVFVCPWCGRMAFFEPEDVQRTRFRKACANKTIDQLRALLWDSNPELLQSAARERIEELEADARWKAEREKEKQESREKRKKFFSGFLGKDGDDDKPTKNRPPEF